MTFTIDGQPVARVGDKVICPRCKTITMIASSRFPTVCAFGQNLAYHHDSTSCGALLISRHNNHAGWDTDPEENPAKRANGNDAGLSSVDEYFPRKPHRFQEHFILHDDAGALMANVPYRATTSEGTTFEGETDNEGRTAVIWTDAPDAIELTVGPNPGSAVDPYHYDEQSYEGL
jgi:ribosomal protein S27AE